MGDTCAADEFTLSHILGKHTVGSKKECNVRWKRNNDLVRWVENHHPIGKGRLNPAGVPISWPCKNDHWAESKYVRPPWNLVAGNLSEVNSPNHGGYLDAGWRQSNSTTMIENCHGSGKVSCCSLQASTALSTVSYSPGILCHPGPQWEGASPHIVRLRAISLSFTIYQGRSHNMVR